MPLSTEFLINGSFGSLKDQNGIEISQIQKVDAKIVTNKQAVLRAGTRSTGYKAMTTTGDGTFTMFKVTSQFLRLIAQMMGSDPNVNNKVIQPQLILNVKNADPESLGIEEYRLLNVKLWGINLGFDVNSIGEEAIPFTFEGFVPVTWIDGDPTTSQYNARYVAGQTVAPGF